MNRLLLQSIVNNPQMIKVKPAVIWFLLKYLRKFTLKETGGHLVIHSHLPPLNSKSYTRFINEHLLAKTKGPSHAQIALTNACPQNCRYCYNKNRTGTPMDTETIIETIQELKKMGVFWLGFTGGEPLLNKEIVRITDISSDGCAVKLFTTGYNLTPTLARDLKKAGLFSVAISLDHHLEEEHDRIRNYPGAYQTALQAITILKEIGGIHLSVSSVLSREMIKNNLVDEFIHFLIKLGVDEAWLSEVKPSVEDVWVEDNIITEHERATLINLQDRYNKDRKITVNYLGHFEDKSCFGCAAGNKMVYIDAFGGVSPCVFTPISFGNVQERNIKAIVEDMQKLFPGQDTCFINENYRLIKKHSSGKAFLDQEESMKLMEEVTCGPLSRFFRLLK